MSETPSPARHSEPRLRSTDWFGRDDLAGFLHHACDFDFMTERGPAPDTAPQSIPKGWHGGW